MQVLHAFKHLPLPWCNRLRLGLKIFDLQSQLHTNRTRITHLKGKTAEFKYRTRDDTTHVVRKQVDSLTATSQQKEVLTELRW